MHKSLDEIERSGITSNKVLKYELKRNISESFSFYFVLVVLATKKIVFSGGQKIFSGTGKNTFLNKQPIVRVV